MRMDLAEPPFEHVVLVDENNHPVGTRNKNDAHHADTPLHRGFSIFLFDRMGRTLLQQRRFGKITWPGVWSNACCGHPQLHESTVDAMHRRLSDELGLTGVDLSILLPDYRYRFERNGVVENEFCPVAVGVVDQPPRPNPGEVNAVRWIGWDEFLAELERENDYSEWCNEEAMLLANDVSFGHFHQALRAGSP